jgi:hypothetical protein
MTPLHKDDLADVLAIIATLGHDEILVVREVVVGLKQGRQVYGPLDLQSDRRDMVGETLEEVRDALVYVGAALVRGKRRGDNRLQVVIDEQRDEIRKLREKNSKLIGDCEDLDEQLRGRK